MIISFFYMRCQSLLGAAELSISANIKAKKNGEKI